MGSYASSYNARQRIGIDETGNATMPRLACRTALGGADALRWSSAFSAAVKEPKIVGFSP